MTQQLLKANKVLIKILLLRPVEQVQWCQCNNSIQVKLRNFEQIIAYDESLRPASI